MRMYGLLSVVTVFTVFTDCNCYISSFLLLSHGKCSTVILKELYFIPNITSACMRWMTIKATFLPNFSLFFFANPHQLANSDHHATATNWGEWRIECDSCETTVSAPTWRKASCPFLHTQTHRHPWSVNVAPINNRPSDPENTNIFCCWLLDTDGYDSHSFIGIWTCHVHTADLQSICLY